METPRPLLGLRVLMEVDVGVETPGPLGRFRVLMGERPLRRLGPLDRFLVLMGERELRGSGRSGGSWS